MCLIESINVINWKHIFQIMQPNSCKSSKKAYLSDKLLKHATLKLPTYYPAMVQLQVAMGSKGAPAAKSHVMC